MNFQNLELKNIFSYRNFLREKTPLIHCITNPISINDCANAVLALGAKPIMAEHPKEVCEITAISNSLAVNLGNITDARLESIMLSGKKAKDLSLNSVIDMVGVACSSLRLDFAKSFVKECSPKVIKGNVSELKALCGEKNNALGIDVGKNDIVTKENIKTLSTLFSQMSKEYNSVIIATGKTDIIAYKNEIYTISNGCEKMSLITGTGCMLNVLIGSFLSVASPLEATILATAYFGVCGELSDNSNGTGSFRTELLDKLYLLNSATFCEMAKIKAFSL